LRSNSRLKHVVIGDHTMMDFPPILIGMSGLGDSMKEIRETAVKDLLQDYTQENKISVLLEALTHPWWDSRC